MSMECAKKALLECFVHVVNLLQVKYFFQQSTLSLVKLFSENNHKSTHFCQGTQKPYTKAWKLHTAVINN